VNDPVSEQLVADAAPVMPQNPVTLHTDSNAETFAVSRSTLTHALVAVVFLLIGLVGGALLSGRGIDSAQLDQVVRQAVGEAVADLEFTDNTNAADPNVTLIDDDPSIGPDDAPVTLVEFSDFYCGFCGRFASDTLQRILTKYDGQIRFVYRDMPIIGGAASFQAAIAAECAADQDKFMEYHSVLFANAANRTREDMVNFAQNLDMDGDAFTACLDNQDMANEVTLDYLDGQALGITGTPAFYINGRFISGAQPYETFVLLIDAELRKQGIEPVISQ
jgi:protein-disulfide isomerase